MTVSALEILLGTAVSIGFIHTLIGIDHSLPFIAVGKARNWGLRKTLGLTALCGLGHVMGSVILGFLGIGLGVAIEELSFIESIRGEITAWLIIGFGLAYASWALLKLKRGKKHSHAHIHENGTVHNHDHDHHRSHAHAHTSHSGAMAAWSLFIIFVFGPCEALIPMLMAPAAEHNWLWVGLVAGAFGITTIATMLGVVTVGYLGLSLKKMQGAEKYTNVFAGLAIAMSGIAIQALGI
jgi:ABC-type nickel/cobalt efflux system permease component RcnA